MTSRRAKLGRLFLFAPGTQAPAASKIRKPLRCTDTAYLGKTVAAGPPDHRRTKQVGMHQAVCVRVAMPSKFNSRKALWPESRTGPVLILPAGNNWWTKVTRSRKQGDRGKGDYERPLREGAHRSRPPAILW